MPSETPKGNLKWLSAISPAGTPDRLAAAKSTFSTESAKSGRWPKIEPTNLRQKIDDKGFAKLHLYGIVPFQLIDCLNGSRSGEAS